MEYGKKGYLEGYEDGKNAAQQKSKELAEQFEAYRAILKECNSLMSLHVEEIFKTLKKGEGK